MREIKKFCGAAVGELPKGFAECGMCDFFAKLIRDGKLSYREQVGCPAEMHPQLHHLKKKGMK